jgi:catechol 2,3-dioxygenase-like lactoylglutathione lyase family enzyme
MVIGTHAIIYAEDAERTRAFIRDILGYSYVDAHEGWLIFKLPPAELGVHPIEPSESGKHELYLMCDDIDRTVADLTAKGVEFSGEVINAGFGMLITIKVPGGGELGLYEPRHPMAISLSS